MDDDSYFRRIFTQFLFSPKVHSPFFSFQSSVTDPLHRIRIRGSIPLTDWDLDPDPNSNPDPSIFITDLQDANKKIILKTKFFCILLFKVLLHHFSKIKSQKEVTKGFSYYFCLMIEGSGSGSCSGSIALLMDPYPDPGGPKTCGSG